MKLLNMLKDNKELIFKTCVLLGLYFITFIIGMTFSTLSNYGFLPYRTITTISTFLILLLNIYLFIKNYKYKNHQIKVIKKIILSIFFTVLLLTIIIALDLRNYITNITFTNIFFSMAIFPFWGLLLTSTLPIYIYIKRIDQKYISEAIYKISLFLSIYPLTMWFTWAILFTIHTRY